MTYDQATIFPITTLMIIKSTTSNPILILPGLQKGQRYHILIVHPKGTSRSEYQYKVNGYRAIFEVDGQPRRIPDNGLRYKCICSCLRRIVPSPQISTAATGWIRLSRCWRLKHRGGRQVISRQGAKFFKLVKIRDHSRLKFRCGSSWTFVAKGSSLASTREI